MPYPLAALAARLGPIVAQMAIGTAARSGAASAGSRVPMGLTMAQGRMRGMGLSSMPPQRIGAGDIVGGGGAASRAANGLGDLAKKLPPVIASFAALPAIAHGFSNRLLEAQRSLTQYNGTIAAAFAKLELGRIQRSIRGGVMTAGTTSDLADSTNRLENALMPLSSLKDNLQNIFLDSLNEVAIFMLNGINKILNPVAARLFGDPFDPIAPNKVDPISMQTFLTGRKDEWIEDQKRRRTADLDMRRHGEK